MRRLLLLVPGLLLMVSAMAWAQNGSSLESAEAVRLLQADLRLTRDGTLTVTESITYDFGASQRHGIYRYIPFRYIGVEGEKYYPKLKLLSVTDGSGRTLPYESSTSGGNAIYKIGDPNKLITGEHTYRLTYTLKPIVRPGEVDQLIFDVVGDGWTVPVQEVQARLESEIPLRTATCLGARCQVSVEPGRVNLEAQDLAAGEALTLDVRLQPNVVGAYLKPVSAWVEAIPLLGVLAGITIILLALLNLIYWKLKDKLARKRQVIIPQYEAPEGMSPAQVGLLDENRSGMPEITATLIDIARRGFIRIEQTAPKRFWRKAEYSLHSLKPSAGLTLREQGLLSALFGGRQTIALDRVDRQKVPEAIGKLHAQIAQELEHKGYYRPPLSLLKWLAGRLGRAGLTAGLLLALTLGIYGHATQDWGFALLSLGIYLAAYLASYPLARLKRRTSQGIARWADVAGFKWFMTVAEKDRLNFHEAPAKTPKLFSQLLPYAVALGVEKQWAKQFEGIDLSEETSWYFGPAGFHFSGSALAGDLASGFSPAVSSNLAAVSSGSGGFSGGGFGGGGGGSW